MQGDREQCQEENEATTGIILGSPHANLVAGSQLFEEVWIFSVQVFPLVFFSTSNIIHELLNCSYMIEDDCANTLLKTGGLMSQNVEYCYCLITQLYIYDD